MIPLLVPIGLALIRKLAPQIVGMVTGSSRAEEIATTVVESVSTATGMTIASAQDAAKRKHELLRKLRQDPDDH